MVAGTTPPTKEQRRSRRFRASLAVDLHEKGGARRVQCTDVGRHGVFLATHAPPRERHLVQLTIHLPGGAIRAAASVTRAIAADEQGTQPPREAGVGVQFFALSNEDKERWDAYVQGLATPAPPRTSSTQLALPPSPGLPVVEAQGATFLVKLSGLDKLRAFQEGHLAAGGTVLFTPVLRDAGEAVTLVVVHPLTEEEFHLPGVVARAHADRPKRLDIHFVGLDVSRQQAFADFVQTGAPPPPPLPSGRPPVTAPAGAYDPVDLSDDWDVDDEDTPWPLAGTTTTTEGFALDIDFTESHDDEEPLDLGAPAPELHSLDAQRPAPDFRLVCPDGCAASALPPFSLGRCPGALGLCADWQPFWSAARRVVVSVPRAVDAAERARRRASSSAANVSLDDAMAIAALADPPTDPDSGAPLRETRAVSRLVQQAQRLSATTTTVRTKLRCSSCDAVLALQRG